MGLAANREKWYTNFFLVYDDFVLCFCSDVCEKNGVNSISIYCEMFRTK